jgi:single-strand DNA-binding protein
MAGVNKVILVCRLGKDPEFRTLDSNGTAVVNFTAATSEVYKDKDGQKKEITDWHNIVLWRGLAELAKKYLAKGDQVYIEGKMRTRSWEKDGITRYMTEVIGDKLTFLTSKGGKVSQDAEKEVETANASSGSDDLPF